MINIGYRKSFFIALGLHIFLAILMVWESSNPRPVLISETKNTSIPAQPLAEQAVKAVSIDNEEIKAAMKRVQDERLKQQRAEQNKRLALQRQVEQARKQRLQEQQHLAKLKEEAKELALARKKQIVEEQKRLQALAEQQKQEAKRLDELKKQAQLQKEQLAIEQEAKKQATEKLIKEQAAKAQAEKIKAEQLELAQKRAAALQQAAADQAQQAKLAGEVDKYKALILNAISRQWILPEKVETGVSSQFRIRLAPDGAVLEVNLTRSSGDAILDRSAQTAIYKASPLPVPQDAQTFNMFRDITLTVRPENVRG